MTEKLFYQDSHIAEFEAEVLSCTAAGAGYEVELDRTVFFRKAAASTRIQGCSAGFV